MTIFTRKALNGSVVERNLPPAVRDVSLGTIRGSCGRVPCALSVAQLVRRNAFFLGGPRSGKSNAIKLATEKLLAQLQPDDFAIIFDPRGDYLKEFYSAERGDLVLSTLSRHRHITESWNVWEEILSADAYRREMFIREIVSRLVKADDPRHQFFVDGARNIFCGVMESARNQRVSLTNARLRQVLCSSVSATGERDPLLVFDSRSEYAYVNEYFTRPNWNAGSDFRSFAKNATEKHFIGSAFGGTGHFSMCRFVREGKGRVLFLEYDAGTSEALATLIGLLIDLAMLTMMENRQSAGRGYFILDELPLIECNEIERACNFMGGQRGCVLAAAQSHSGMYARYGEYQANSIIASFASVFFFQCGDVVSREYIKKLCGVAEVETLSSSGYFIRTQTATQSIVDDNALNGLRVGQAIVRMPEGNGFAPPFVFQFDEYR